MTDSGAHDHHARMDVLGGLRASATPAGVTPRVTGGPGGGDGPGGPTGTVRPARTGDEAAIGRLQAATLGTTLAAGLGLTPGTDLPPEIAGALDPAGLAASWAQAVGAPPTPQHRMFVAEDGGLVVGFAAIAPADQQIEVERTSAVDARDAAELAAEPAQDPVPEGPAGTGARATAEAVLAERNAGAGADPHAGQPTGTHAPADDPSALPDPAAPSGRRVEIVALEVPEEFGRRGHGSRLMAAVVDTARDQGAGVLQAWAVQGEESRARFLDSCGFAPMGMRREAQLGERRLVEICWQAAI